ncbi:MAG: T9SS type A sorting domain-containing protein [Candidatus Poribacteria bacterium]|nr:T9SS type A sorting domain-containing protein [Candidatus Poribacteria bacterium]
MDSDGNSHGVVLENGELRQYDFPNAVQTEIYGISDVDGKLTGNFTDASGVRRGFSGDAIIEVPEALETFADFVNASGRLVGSYVDADGLYHPYVSVPDGRFISIDLPQAAKFEFFFVHGINDVGTLVGRTKKANDVPRTTVGTFQHGLRPLLFPGSVSTEGWNINQDGSIVGHYESADGRTHGFIARPVSKTVSDHFGNTFNVTLTKGLNMLSVPLASPKPRTAKSLAGLAGATMVIALDAENQRFIGWTPSAPTDGFSIEGGQGYIVNVSQTRNFAFVGSRWTNQTEAAAAPPAISEAQEAWAFVISGQLEGRPVFDGYQVIVRNMRTNSTITTSVQDNYFAAATADLSLRSVVQVGDVIELRVIGPNGNVESQTINAKVTPESLANAVLSVKLDNIGKPTQNQLLQNYPNPFNPETWIPYQLSQDSPVSISIYDMTGKLIRTLSLGFQSAGFYNNRERAAYWDGRNALGERVASGVYFYQLTTPSFQQTRRMIILK